MKPRSRKASRTVLVVCLVAVSAGTAAAAESVLSVPGDTRIKRNAERPRLTLRDLADNRRQFAVLNEKRTAADVLPARLLRTIKSAWTSGIDVLPEYARRVAVTDGQARYLIPGKKWICLMSDTGAGSCNFSKAAADGYLMTVSARTTGIPSSVVRLQGAVPDRVERVAVKRRDGRMVIAATPANVYVVDVDSPPDSVTYVDRGGKSRSVEVPFPPAEPTGETP